MVDAVTIHFPKKYCEGFSCSFSKIKRQDINTFSGSLGPLKVFHSLAGITITGSLPKYLYGENVTMLDTLTTQVAINILGQETGLNMRHGLVCKIEVGKNLFTQRPPAEYLSLFGYSGRYMRAEYTKPKGTETVHYYNQKGDFQFILYDKGLESTGRIPKQYEGLNILRAEYRAMHAKGIRRKFGQNLSAFDLGQEDVFNELERQFLEFYYSIPKMGKEIIMANGNITSAQFEKIIAERFRQSNPKEYLDILQSLKLQGKIDKVNLCRIRARERQSDKGFKWQDNSPLIQELDTLIKGGKIGQDKYYPLRLVKTA